MPFAQTAAPHRRAVATASLDLRSAPQTARVIDPVDWAAHRQTLIECHSLEASLRQVIEEISQAAANKQAFEERSRHSLEVAQATTRTIKAELAALKKQLDESIKTSPKEVRLLLRDVERYSSDLDTKRNALSRLTSNLEDSSRHLEELERQREADAAKHQPAPEPRSIDDERSRAACEIKSLLETVSRADKSLRRSLRQEIHSRPALSTHLSSAALATSIDAIASTLIKFTLRSSLPSIGLEHTSHDSPLHPQLAHLLTRQLPPPLGVRQAPNALMLLAGVGLMVVITANNIHQQRAYNAEVHAKITKIREIVKDYSNWWPSVLDIFQQLRKMEAADEPLSAAAQKWMEIVRVIEDSFQSPEQGIARIFLLRDALSINTPFECRTTHGYNQAAVFERELKQQYVSVLDRLADSCSQHPTMPLEIQAKAPSTLFFVATAAACLITLVTLINYGLRNTKSAAAIYRARSAADQVVGHIRSAPTTRSWLDQLATKARDSQRAMESLNAEDAGPLERLKAVRELASDEGAGVSNIVEALNEIRSALASATGTKNDLPHRTAGLDDAIATEKKAIETHKTSIQRKEEEIKTLETALANLDKKLKAQLDTKDAEDLLARIANKQGNLEKSQEAEIGIKTEYEKARRQYFNRELELLAQDRSLRAEINKAETRETVAAARDAITRLATPAALSRATERHVALQLDALESRLRFGRFTASQGYQVNTAPVELASSYYSHHALHLALIDAIEKAPENAGEAGQEKLEVAIGHDIKLGITAFINDRNETSAKKSSRSMVCYSRSHDGTLRVAHIYPA